jgi:hypothetical protein
MAKTVLDKIVAAITQLAEPGGASRPAINKAVKEMFGEVKPALMKKALSTGVQKGQLVQSGQRFGVAGIVLEAREEASVAKTVLRDGNGRVADSGDTVDMAYHGTLEDGSTFDKAAHFKFQLGLGEVIKGWDLGVAGMRVGERAKLVVPSKLGYGKRGSPPEIPPDATLIFDVTLNRIVGACGAAT